MTQDPHNPDSDDIAGSRYEPSYSEPSWDTSANDSDWETPAHPGLTPDQDDEHASAPDAGPLHEGEPGSPLSTGVDDGAADPSGDAPADDRAHWTGPAPGQQPPSGGQHFQQPPMQGQHFQQPPMQGQHYQQPPMQGQHYQQPPMGGMPPQYYGVGHGPMATGGAHFMGGATDQGRSTLMLDYWLSVFFSWIPALIFFLTERDKNKLVDDHTKELLNFNITRMIVYATMIIPIVGTILGGIASVALFVMAIIGAVKGPEEYANGRPYKFPFTLRLIK